MLFQRLYVNPQAEQEYQRWVSSYQFNPGTRTSLEFYLHPGIVDYLVSELRWSQKIGQGAKVYSTG